MMNNPQIKFFSIPGLSEHYIDNMAKVGITAELFPVFPGTVIH